MPAIVMYTKAMCPYCVAAKNWFTAHQVAVEEVRVDLDPARFDEMLVRSGHRRTVPQIFIGDTHVGGYDDLMALHRQGKVQPLLDAPG